MSLVDQSWTKVEGLEVADQPKESTRDQFDIKIGKLNNKINDKTNKSGTSIGKALGRRTHNKQLERNLQIGEHSILRLLAPMFAGWSPAVTNYRHLSVIMFKCVFFSKSVFNIINLQLHYEIKICFTKNSVFQSH